MLLRFSKFFPTFAISKICMYVVGLNSTMRKITFWQKSRARMIHNERMSGKIRQMIKLLSDIFLSEIHSITILTLRKIKDTPFMYKVMSNQKYCICGKVKPYVV